MFDIKLGNNVTRLPELIFTSALVAAALGLLLGLATTTVPALADNQPPGACHKHDKDCGEPGPASQAYTVEVFGLRSVSTNAFTCQGETGADSKGLAVFFPDAQGGCPQVMVEVQGSDCPELPVTTGLYLRVSQISVKNTRKQTGVTIFAREEFGNETTYVTGFLEGVIVPNANGFEINSGSGTPIAPQWTQLTKVHQPCKGLIVDGIAVDSIVYTRSP